MHFHNSQLESSYLIIITTLYYLSIRYQDGIELLHLVEAGSNTIGCINIKYNEFNQMNDIIVNYIIQSCRKYILDFSNSIMTNNDKCM